MKKFIIWILIAFLVVGAVSATSLISRDKDKGPDIYSFSLSFVNDSKAQAFYNFEEGMSWRDFIDSENAKGDYIWSIDESDGYVLVSTAEKTFTVTYKDKLVIVDDALIKDAVYIMACELHSMNEGELVKLPTVDEFGMLRMTCQTCGYYVDEEIAKISVSDGALNGSELSTYGQQSYFIGNAVTTAPSERGTVNAAEYNLTVLNMAPSAKSAAYSMTGDNRFFISSTNTQTVNDVDIYAAKDSEYIYLATTVTNTDENMRESVYFDIGNGLYTNSMIRVFVEYRTGNPRVLGYLASCTSNEASDVIYYDISEELLKKLVASFDITYDENTNMMHVKLKLKQSGLVDPEALLLRLEYKCTDISTNTNNGSIWFGFVSGIENTFAMYSRYPHVITLTQE